MDNQQETLNYIAGIFEGEGSIILSKVNCKQKFIQYRGIIQFTNTEPEICQKYIDFCKDNHFHIHVRRDERKSKPNSKICYQISLTRLEDRIRFLETLIPKFVGKKVDEGKIVLQFLNGRLEKYSKQKHRSKDGKFRSGCKSSFDEKDELLYQKYKSIKGSSTTTRKNPVEFNLD